MTFSTGLSALRANQTAMSVVGNNIANASTEGFRREEVVFAENPHVNIGGLSIGTGVSISDIRRVGDAVLEAAIRDGTSDGAMLSARLQNARQIESLFLPGTGTLQERTEEFFLNLERLSALPTDGALRSTVIHSAGELGDEVNRVSNALDAMTAATDLEIEKTLEAVREAASEIADLNRRIVDAENSGKSAHGLRNQRDLLLRDLSSFIDVERHADSDGRETFLMGGGLFTLESGLSDMQLIRNDAGKLEVWKEGCNRPHEITGGKLAGLLGQSNGPGGIEDIKSKLNEFVSTIALYVDGAHATGIGIGEAFETLRSGRLMKDTTVPLASLDLIHTMEPGNLHVNVNDQTAGTRTLHQIAINPSTQSLEDVAQLIGAIDHLSATVGSSGGISIAAEAGFTFDFTGNLQSEPAAAAITGTTRPSISGRYTGSDNDEFRFRFTGAGTVGVTSGLQVEVVDKDNAVMRVLDVGRDYAPGSELIIGDGVSLSLSSGTAASGDSFETTLAAQPDETGMLAALGLNTLFVGDEASSLRVNPLIEENPFLLATTTNGDPSDTRNLLRMIAVRDAHVMRDGMQTLEQFLGEMAASVGTEVGELTRDVGGHDEHQAFLEAELAAVTGVDVNEELARMLQYQRSYQAAARYIATIDQMLQELFSLVR